jgi:hypothetical protein
MFTSKHSPQARPLASTEPLRKLLMLGTLAAASASPLLSLTALSDPEIWAEKH